MKKSVQSKFMTIAIGSMLLAPPILMSQNVYADITYNDEDREYVLTNIHSLDQAKSELPEHERSLLFMSDEDYQKKLQRELDRVTEPYFASSPDTHTYEEDVVKFQKYADAYESYMKKFRIDPGADETDDERTSFYHIDTFIPMANSMNWAFATRNIFNPSLEYSLSSSDKFFHLSKNWQEMTNFDIPLKSADGSDSGYNYHVDKNELLSSHIVDPNGDEIAIGGDFTDFGADALFHASPGMAEPIRVFPFEQKTDRKTFFRVFEHDNDYGKAGSIAIAQRYIDPVWKIEKLSFLILDPTINSIAKDKVSHVEAYDAKHRLHEPTYDDMMRSNPIDLDLSEQLKAKGFPIDSDKLFQLKAYHISYLNQYEPLPTGRLVEKPHAVAPVFDGNLSEYDSYFKISLPEGVEVNAHSIDPPSAWHNAATILSKNGLLTMTNEDWDSLDGGFAQDENGTWWLKAYPRAHKTALSYGYISKQDGYHLDYRFADRPRKTIEKDGEITKENEKSPTTPDGHNQTPSTNETKSTDSKQTDKELPNTGSHSSIILRTIGVVASMTIIFTGLIKKFKINKFTK